MDKALLVWWTFVVNIIKDAADASQPPPSPPATKVSTLSIYEGLYNHVKAHSTNPNVAPIYDVSKPFMVGLRMGLQGISNVDRENQQVELSVMIAITWNSHIMWNPSDYNGLIMIPVPRDMVWSPDISILNAATHPDDLAPAQTTLFANGLSGLVHQYHMKVLCPDIADGANRCNIGAAISTHGNGLIHLHDPNDLPNHFDLFFNFSRHYASAYPVKESRHVKSTYKRAGFPVEKDRVDLEFTFGDPHRHHRHRNIFTWN